jgi:hypothetical protein
VSVKESVRQTNYDETPNLTKFIVKVDRGSTRAPEYVQRIDVTSIQTTPNRKLALVMGRWPRMLSNLFTIPAAVRS